MNIPSPSELITQFPLSRKGKADILQNRNTIQKILTQPDIHPAILLGPCSLHHKESALWYAEQLLTLQKEIGDACFLVMRAYVEKPRSCLGWKGLLHDPYRQGIADLFEGLCHTREWLCALAHTGIPLATEILDPLAYLYFEDLISWGFIGSRTHSSQVHRQIASSLSFPVGFKNGLEGNLEEVVQSALSASSPHSYFSVDDQGKIEAKHSKGNPYSHIVLRGERSKPNYHPQIVQKAIQIGKTQGLTTKLVIDCSHGNSQKDPQIQKKVFLSVSKQIATSPACIAGLMLESHRQEGKQPPSPHADPWCSITDPCVDWETTRQLVLHLTSHILTSSTV